MKKIVLFLLFSILCSFAYSQEKPKPFHIKQVIDSLNKREANPAFYSDKAEKFMLDATLNNFIESIFDKVMLDAKGDITNGTAMSLAVENKVTLGFNYTHKIAKQSAFSIGINSSVADGERSFFEKKKFNFTDVGLNLKFSLSPHSNFAKLKNATELKINRREYINKDLYKILNDTYAKTSKNNIESLAAEIRLKKDTLERITDTLKSISNKAPDSLFYNYLNKVPSQKTLKTQIDSLCKLYDQACNYKDQTDTELFSTFFKIANDSIVNFEANPYYSRGYKVKWFDAMFTLDGVSKSTLYNKDVVSSEGVIENKTFLKPALRFAGNIASKSTYYSCYANLNIGFQIVYPLEGQSPIDTLQLSGIKVDGKGIYDISKLPNYNHGHIAPLVGFIFDQFFGEKSIWGTECAFDVVYRGNVPNVASDRKYGLTGRLGLLLNLAKQLKNDKIPVVGLYGNLSDWNFKNNFKETFSIGIRVGIAFDSVL